MEKEKFDAIMQEIENEVQARLKEKEKIDRAPKRVSNLIKQKNDGVKPSFFIL